MPWNRKQIRVLFALVAFGVLLFVGLQNLGTVWGFVQILIGLLMPFIIGLCIAFILSVPMRAVETHLFRPLDKKCGRIWRKIRRARFGRPAQNDHLRRQHDRDTDAQRQQHFRKHCDRRHRVHKLAGDAQHAHPPAGSRHEALVDV